MKFRDHDCPLGLFSSFTLRQVAIGWLTYCRVRLAILLESISFYLSRLTTHRHGPRCVHVYIHVHAHAHAHARSRHCQQSTACNQEFVDSPDSTVCHSHQPWLHRRLDQPPRSRPPSRDPLVRSPDRTQATLSHRPPTIPASCLLQSSFNVPFPTTRGPILRVEEVCTRWRNNRTRPVGGGPVRSCRSTTNPPSRLNSLAIALHCPTATQTGLTQKVHGRFTSS